MVDYLKYIFDRKMENKINIEECISLCGIKVEIMPTKQAIA